MPAFTSWMTESTGDAGLAAGLAAGFGAAGAGAAVWAKAAELMALINRPANSAQATGACKYLLLMIPLIQKLMRKTCASLHKLFGIF
jgi:hypothetical protein